ncbi:MAG: EscU/YscU/HrcU family type III secretion system export apparatus switch protein, partial [Phycisphaerae bacterium]|nr:EscU/YscU/HrcU family type III secretion system export apparatus switch protein [Phycisphaerae bacterium]
MADDAGDRTEQPTQRRRDEARKEGRVPRSQDLTASVGLAAGVILLSLFGRGMLEHMLALVGEIGTPSVRAGDLTAPVVRIAHHAVMILVPFIGTLLVVTAVGVLAQFGLLLTPKKIMPDLNNINPLRGLKQVFSKQSVVRLLLGVLKIAIIGAVSYYTIMGDLDGLLGMTGLSVWGVLFAGAEVLYKLALRLALVLLVLGIADYVYQRASLEQSLKMTKQEVKDEMKRMDGDPLLRRRQ